MPEVVANPTGITYDEKTLATMNGPYSKLKPIEPGDTCCNCGDDCDGEGFVVGKFRAMRVNGHPFCSRGGCYPAQIEEFVGRRSGCRCGLKADERTAKTTKL